MKRQDLGFSDNHFHMSAEQKADLQNGGLTTPKKRGAGAGGGDDQMASDQPDLAPPEKVVNVAREGHVLHRSIESARKKIEADV